MTPVIGACVCSVDVGQWLGRSLDRFKAVFVIWIVQNQSLLFVRSKSPTKPPKFGKHSACRDRPWPSDGTNAQHSHLLRFICSSGRNRAMWHASVKIRYGSDGLQCAFHTVMCDSTKLSWDPNRCYEKYENYKHDSILNAVAYKLSVIGKMLNITKRCRSL